MKTILLAFTIKNGAVSSYFTELAAEAVRRGYRVVIITDGQKHALVDTTSNPVILTWPSPRPTRLRDALFLYRVIKQYKPVISISIFGSINLVTLVSFLTGVSRRWAWIRSLSKQFKQKKIHKWRKALVYRMTTRLIVNSKATQKDALKNYGLNPRKLQVIYNAISLPARPPQRNIDTNKITYAGRLHPSKGVDVLLKAFARVAETCPRKKLYILGDGEQMKYLKKLAGELGIANRVYFLGSVSHEEVLKHFSESLFVVTPSYYEAFGFVIIEAFSTGTPVIGGDAGGPSEIIRHKVDGYLFPPGDVKSLSGYMEDLCRHPQKAIKMGEQAFFRAQTTFELKNVIRQVMDLIEEDLKNLS